MTDLLQGVIVGGIIGAVPALIHGYYLLKSTRQQISALERQHATQLDHEKNSQLTSALIAQRRTYLPAVSQSLAELHRSVRHFQELLYELLASHLLDVPNILSLLTETDPRQLALTDMLDKAPIVLNNQARDHFTRQFDQLSSHLPRIEDCRKNVDEACFKVADTTLRSLLLALSDRVILSRRVYYLDLLTLSQQQPHEHSLSYHCRPLWQSLSAIIVHVAHCNHRIELLLSGADTLDK